VLELDRVQALVDDVVVAAAAFRPNTRRVLGPHPLAALRERYDHIGASARRLFLAVTPLELYAFALTPWSHLGPPIGRWHRDELQVSALTARGQPCGTRWPAMLVADGTGKQLFEVQADPASTEAELLTDLLVWGHAVEREPRDPFSRDRRARRRVDRRSPPPRGEPRA
jgi:hypothetical protein